MSQAEWKENLELLNGFIVEAKEHFESIDQKFLTLEDEPDNAELIDEIFRSIHTVKGGAGMLSLQGMAGLAHRIETLLNIFRDLRKVSEPEALDIMQKGCEKLAMMLDHVADEIAGESWNLDPSDKRVDELNNLVEIMTSKCKGESVSASGAPKGPAIDFYKSFADTAHSLETILKSIQDNSANFQQEELTQELVKLATALDFLGSTEHEPAILGLQESFLAYSDADEIARPGTLANALSLLHDLVAKNKKEETAVIAKVSAAKKEGQSQGESKTIRIDQKLIDSVMNLVGEVIVSRNSFEQILRNAQKDPSIPELFFKDLREATKNIIRISEEMQRNVMQMRMIPVKNLFQKFPRLVRDISKKSGKKIDLVLIGEHTEIDKAIAEDVADPLLHMIRNSIDHGIERPEVRAQNGKKDTGTITMRALHEGNYMIIEVADDGGGINRDKVLRKAIERGIVSDTEAAHLSEEDILNFIFAPGFSTADQVTDLSGRGVGMDVVNSNIRKLKGKIRVQSKPGHGTTIRLELPLTMAVLDSLLVKVESSIYALPLEAVQETLKIPMNEVRSINQRGVYNLRNEVIPMQSLRSSVGLKSDVDSDSLTVLVVKTNDGKTGLVVDSIFRQEEIVVKALPDYLAENNILSGASILGDGRAILILDVNKLITIPGRSLPMVS